MPDPTPPPVDALVESLARVVRGYYDDLAISAGRHGLTTTQARVLIALREPLSMRSLAEHLACDASNATGLIARLEARGLVCRAASEADRRKKVVTATAAGRSLAERIRAELPAVRGALAALTDAERAGLLPLLDRLGSLLAR